MQASQQELAAGVNLGNATTGPLFEQGQKVFQAINAKNQIVHGRFRNVLMFNNPPDWLADVANERKQELAKRIDLINEKQVEIYKLAKPVPRKIVVKMRDSN